MQLAGEVVDLNETERAQVLKQRSALTLAEATLMKIAKDPAKDLDSHRGEISKCVAGLRACGLKEKQVLNAALYKWMFKVICGR